MNTQVKQQRQLATFAIGGTFLIWFVAMVLSYESQVEFAISIGMTSTIFGISKAYAFPVLTDTVIFVSAAWSLLATLQGLPNTKYRVANLFFGGVTIWFNTHSIDLSQADYTAIFAVAWIPAMVIISTEMLLSYFQQQAEMQREFVGKETDIERRMMKIETLVELGRADTVSAKKQLNVTQEKSLNYTSAVAGDDENEEIQENKALSPLEKAHKAREAKNNEELDKTLALLNQGKSTEYIADVLGVTPKTVLNRKDKLNGRVNHAN